MILAWTPAAWACQCTALTPFEEAVARAGAVIAGRVVAVTPEGALELEVTSSLEGPSAGTRVRVWGDSGKSCRPPIGGYRVGTEWVFVAETLVDASVPGPLPGDWGLPACTSPALPVAHGRVTLSGRSVTVAAAEAGWRERREALVLRTKGSLKAGNAVVVEGRRENAKAGPVLLVDGVPVYLAGREPWTEAECGSSVPLRGWLAEEAFLPPPVSPEGEVQQGGDGTQWVLHLP